jgi:hypothetical protein
MTNTGIQIHQQVPAQNPESTKQLSSAPGYVFRPRDHMRQNLIRSIAWGFAALQAPMNIYNVLFNGQKELIGSLVFILLMALMFYLLALAIERVR